ncbi:TPA: hypothetical protein L9L57_005037 [Klebsiella pneumoniae]|nr:hypothetical protein [Klebsiella pneumoniae]HBR1477742.1 hypothetical protein [Klebsiella pneumoniae]
MMKADDLSANPEQAILFPALEQSPIAVVMTLSDFLTRQQNISGDMP